jgi:RNA polymerase sigma-70 factor, ECF subfamily
MADWSGATDEELLRAVVDGDTGALRTLYDRHAPWISVRLRRRCNDPGLVAEVVQDTFVAVWRGARSYRGDGAAAGWLWGIAVRRLVSSLRGKSAGEIPVADISTGFDASAEERVLVGIEYGDLGAAMARLSPEMRAVLQATVLDGLTTREAARLLGVPTGTIKTRLHRATAQLRRELTRGLA